MFPSNICTEENHKGKTIFPISSIILILLENVLFFTSQNLRVVSLTVFKISQEFEQLKSYVKYVVTIELTTVISKEDETTSLQHNPCPKWSNQHACAPFVDILQDKINTTNSRLSLSVLWYLHTARLLRMLCFPSEHRTQDSGGRVSRKSVLQQRKSWPFGRQRFSHENLPNFVRTIKKMDSQPPPEALVDDSCLVECLEDVLCTVQLEVRGLSVLAQ